jgi:opine dehydrogenase
MKIAIIGAGNGGHAMAGHFRQLGHEIVLYNRSIARIRELLENPTIFLSERLSGEVRIDHVTYSIEDAVKNAALIMITTTANAHADLAREMASFLAENQVIVLNPGRTLGAIEFSVHLQRYTNKRVYIAEAQSLIYACRIESARKVRIIGIKDKVLISAYPSRDTLHVLRILNEVFPCFVEAESILETGLENIGAMFHPAVILFNAASIERGEMFYFYNDMTPAVAGFLEALDQERLAVGKAFGFNLLSLSEWVSYAYSGINGDTLCEKMRNNPAYFEIKAPDTLRSRLLLEDVPTGILPLIELGKIAGVQTPLLNAIFNIAQSILGEDFVTNGRTLKNLGLEGITIQQLKEIC